MKTATDYETLTPDELSDALIGIQLASLNAAALLSIECGGTKKAARQIRLALDLPPPVLQRRYDRAHAIMEANGKLSIAETAAWIACAHFTTQLIAAVIERKQSGAPVQ